jgi:hypothetical protein
MPLAPETLTGIVSAGIALLGAMGSFVSWRATRRENFRVAKARLRLEMARNDAQFSQIPTEAQIATFVHDALAGRRIDELGELRATFSKISTTESPLAQREYDDETIRSLSFSALALDTVEEMALGEAKISATIQNLLALVQRLDLAIRTAAEIERAAQPKA